MSGRDFGAEIVTAIAGNDVQGLAKIAIELLGRVSKDDERRNRQAEKKRRQRGQSPDLSTTVPGQPETKSGFPSDSPSSKNTKRPQLNRARDMGLNVDLVDADGVPLSQVEEIDEAVAAFGKTHAIAWPAVSRFLCRRPLRTWLGWIREMRKQVGPGSQYTEADLAATCDDDATLTRQIGSPLGLKGFLLRSRTDRVNPPNLDREPPRNGKQNPGAQQVENIRQMFKTP